MAPTFLEEAASVHAVEGILKVHSESYPGGVNCVALRPLTDSVGSGLGAQWLGNADLQRRQVVGNLVADAIAEALGHEPAPCFSDRDGANAAIILGKSGQRSAGKERCDRGWGRTVGESLCQGGNVGEHLVP